MGIIDKSMIEKWILPHLTVGTRGFETTVPLVEIVEYIFHRLKTGYQWRELPTKQFFSAKILHWNSVFYQYNKWRQPLLYKAGCWKSICITLLCENPAYLDLSSVQFEGSPTPAKNGGDAVGYQGRKSCKTTNFLFLSDNQWFMLAMCTPQQGQHHDLFQIQELFGEICGLLEEACNSLRGLFLNADAGFDSAEFVSTCESREIMANVRENPRNSTGSDQESYQSGTHVFDAGLYAHRSVIEHANAWLDGFKALLIRFEFSARNWKSLHFIAFALIFLRKINRQKKV